MNIEQGLEDHMNNISPFCGFCLSIEERLKLNSELSKLKSEIKCEEILFWGKIMGAEKDYYIAMALNYKDKPNFPKKTFYFCSSSNFLFSELSQIQPHHIPDFRHFNTYFIGNPDIILKKYSSVDSNEDSDKQIQKGFNPNLKPKNLTESDRLSYVVRTIEDDTSVVPVGGFKMIPIGEMRRNDVFDGLSVEDLDKLEKYAHFRKTRNEDKKDIIELGDAVFNFGFLDSIVDDPIKDCWSIQVNSEKTVSHIRSIIWPGYFAYHKANSDMFGGVYIGYGIKNVDIPFMQQ